VLLSRSGASSASTTMSVKPAAASSAARTPSPPSLFCIVDTVEDGADPGQQLREVDRPETG
jgi:hypothetical protein